MNYGNSLFACAWKSRWAESWVCPLENLSHTGDLSDCFKVYFDFPRGDRPDYRLVYRKNPDETIVAVAVQIVAAGRRESLAVYLEAARRLGR